MNAASGRRANALAMCIAMSFAGTSITACAARLPRQPLRSSDLAQTDPSPPRPAYLPRLDAVPDPTLTLVEQIGGMTVAMATKGTYAFAGVGARVFAWDTAHPADDGVAVFGRSPVLPRLVRDLAVDGDRLYAAVGGAGVLVLDIARPLEMTIIDRHNTPGDARTVAVDGGRVYVADRAGGVRILDAGRPGLPLLGSWTAPHRVHDVVPHGDHAFAAVDETGVVALSVKDPAAIVAVGTEDGEARRLLAVGDTLWVAADNGGVEILDVTDPGALRSVAKPYPAHYGGGDFVAGMAAQGDLVFISGAELAVWDVADPRAPRRLDVAAAPRDRYCEDCGDAIALAGDLAVVGTAEDGGLETWSFTDPVRPVRVRGELGLGAQYWPVLFQAPGGVLFTAVRRLGGPVERTSMLGLKPSPFLDADGENWQDDVLVEGAFAYSVGDTPDGQLVVDDLTNTAAPRRIGAAAHGLPFSSTDVWRGGRWAGHRLAKAGDRIVLSGGIYGWGCPTFAVVDAADPSRPRFLSVLGWLSDEPAQAERPAPNANYVGLALTADGAVAIGVDNGWHCDAGASGWGGIEAIDLTDPAKPRIADRLGTEFEQLDVAVHGHHAFVAAGEGGLRVYDIADPDALREVGAWDDGDDAARQIVLAWPHVLLALSKRIVVLDIRSPGAPRVVGTADVPGETRALRIGAGRVWALTRDAGLVGYSFRGGGP